MKYKRTIQQVRVLAVLLCLAAFLVLNSSVHLQIRHYKNEEQLAATYTAEATVRRIEAQLNRYLSRSDLLKNIIESGVDIDESSYDDLCRYMLDSDGIIRALDRPDAEIVPILALTANAFAEDARKCLDAGMNAHLAKPLNMPLVKATIAKFTQHSTTV